MPLEFLARRIGRPFVCAHRGFSSLAPENTIAAFDAAWSAGAEFIETDIRLTRDGHVVVIHDDSVDRTTDGTGLVRDKTLVEIKGLDAGKWRDARFSGERVPTLADVLEWCRGRLGLLIEIKDFPHRDTRLVDEAIRVIEARQASEFVSLGSFDHITVAKIHRTRPHWSLHMNVHARLADPVHEAYAAGAGLICLEPEFFLESDVQALHAAGVALHSPLPSPGHAAELLAWGVDILESDDVAMVAQVLGVPRRHLWSYVPAMRRGSDKGSR